MLEDCGAESAKASALTADATAATSPPLGSVWLRAAAKMSVEKVGTATDDADGTAPGILVGTADAVL